MALIGVVGWWLWPSAPGEAAAEAASPARACTFTAGQRLAYDVRSTSHLSVDFGAMIGGLAAAAEQRRDVPVTMRWRLELEVLQADERQALVAARWTRVRAVGAGGVTIRGDELAHPALFRLTHDCRVSAFARHPASSAAAARTQQAALLRLSLQPASWGAGGALVPPKCSCIRFF